MSIEHEPFDIPDGAHLDKALHSIEIPPGSVEAARHLVRQLEHIIDEVAELADQDGTPLAVFNRIDGCYQRIDALDRAIRRAERKAAQA